MSYFRPEIEAMAGYVPGEQPQERRVHQAQHQREPVSAVAGGGRRRSRRRCAAGCKSIPTRWPAPFAAGRPRCWASSPTGSWRQRQRRHPDDRHPGAGGRGPTAAAAVSQLHPLQDAGRAPGRAERGGPLRAGLVAAASGLPTASADLRLVFLANPNSPSGTVVPPERGAGAGRAAALSAAGRRGLRRFRRDELPGAGRPEREDHGLADASASRTPWPGCGSATSWPSRR